MVRGPETLQALIDANDQGVFALDLSLRYTAFNRAHAAAMHELYGAEISLGGCLSDYQTVDADREGARSFIEKAFAGERAVAITQSGEADRQRSYEIVHTPQLDAAGEVVGVLVRAYDVTRSRRAESELRESEERYTLLFGSMLDGFAYCRMLYDAEGRPDDFVYLAVNPAFERLTGLKDAVGRRVTEVIPDIKRETPELFAAYDRVVETGEPSEFEIDFTPLGLWLRISVTRPEAGHFVAVFADITARKRAETAVSEGVALYRSILKASPDDITVTDLEGRILLVSPTALSMLGCEREEDMLGRSMMEFLAPEDRERAQANVGLMFEGVFPGPEQYFAVRADATKFPIEINGEFIRDADGRPARMVFVVRDITERKRAEDEIRRLNAELEERVVSRTEQRDAAARELESFAYSVSHDVRTPLRTIDGFSAAVMEDEVDRLSPDGIAALRRVRSAAQTLARLLDDLMGLSHVSRRELSRQHVDITRLAEEVGEETAADNPARVVKLRVAPGLNAYADPGLVRLILRELLGNAWKFTGPIPEAHVEVGALDRGGERVFSVRDDGVGFDMRFADHLFGPFQRMHTADAFGGDGIGLATVQRLVARHGGRVWAESEVGEGATFYFTLSEPSRVHSLTHAT